VRAGSEAGTGLRGVVATFDVDRGLGTIMGEDGIERMFHCTQIADGSRTIEVGTAVAFGLLAKLGRFEATAIAPR